MLLIRRFEEKAGQLYGMGLIGGFCHLYIGQEAVVVGMQAAIRAGKDSVITSYRDHGHMLACGMDPKGVMAELTGRRGGYSKGKGGSMHMFSREKKFYGGHGIVGAQVPIGTGLAFAHKYSEDNGAQHGLFRRRRAEPGPGLRKLQHGGPLEAAGGLCDREQPIRHGHLGERVRPRV
jgi:pyruvate dehydrogenase E1 component alpha subunit